MPGLMLNDSDAPDSSDAELDGYETSDDSIASYDGHDWEWIYSTTANAAASRSEGSEEEDEIHTPSRKRRRKHAGASFSAGTRRIIGARKGNLEVHLGDAVVLRAERNEIWVALLCNFVEEEEAAEIMWFAQPSEIRNKSKRRGDAMPVSITTSANQIWEY
ncbi:hypothetical protein MRB53_037187 [Persea americana]|nr:hypothetical protein MRB53_037187 [Persea americana]